MGFSIGGFGGALMGFDGLGWALMRLWGCFAGGCVWGVSVLALRPANKSRRFS